MSENSYFNSVLVIAKETDIFKGDLHVVQYLSLHHLLFKDRENLLMVENERMKYTILANNPTLYNALYEKKDIDGDFSDKQVEWITPSSVQEAEDLIKMMQSVK